MNKKYKNKIYYLDIWGLREEKNEWLDKNDIQSTKWQELNPSNPYYFFVPKSEKGVKKYQGFPKIIDIFPVNGVGIVTGRDDFVIDSDKRSLEARMRIFRDEQNDDNFIKNSYNLKDKPSSRWLLKDARKKVQEDEDWDEHFAKILYRPFDERWIYYHPALIERHRNNVMKHMTESNLAIMTTRQQADEGFYHSFVTDKIPESCLISNKTREIGYVFPLYFYNGQNDNGNGKHNGIHNNGIKNGIMFEEEKRKSNIKPEIIKKLSQVYKKEISAEEIFYYIYSALYSNTYREKYQEFLKVDFPRIPFTKDYSLFIKFGKLGEQLVNFHLLKSPELDNPVVKFYGEADGIVDKIEHIKKSVYINKNQYFSSIKPEVWNYHIGGYQVLHKWLKDRKNRRLSSEDIKHYCRIVTVISKTIEIQKQIDKLYPTVEKNLTASD